MIISISGDLGAGKSTVSKILATKLGLPRYYAGGIWRALAAKKGVDVYELNKLAENNPKIDYEMDEYTTKLGKTQDNFVIDSRLAWHFIPGSYKIYLHLDPKEAAQRIFFDEREHRKNEKIYKNLEEATQAAENRRASERKRYLKFYKIDLEDKKNYDLIINTTKISPQEVVEKIIASLPTDEK